MPQLWARWLAHLRPGGTAILSVPAYQQRFAAADTLVGHHRRYDPDQLGELLGSVGLENGRTVPFGGPAGRMLERLRNALARRPLASGDVGSIEERGAASGRWIQPRDGPVAFGVYVGALPLRQLQRMFPRSGPGLVGTADQAGRDRC